MIVPDSIEPVTGWKALRVIDVDQLRSPQQSFIWPAKERAEATCPGPPTFRWVARKGKPPEERDPRRVIVQPGGRVITNMAVPNVYTSTTTSISIPINYASNTTSPLPLGELAEEGVEFDPDSPQTPKVELPAGLHWSWEPVRHEAASDNNCTCGIYMVDDPVNCGYYVDDWTVIVEVAGWGHVIRGDHGNRVQYAYPQRLLAPARLEKTAVEVAERYEIPYEIVDKLQPNPTTALAAQLTAITAAQAKTQAQFKQAQAVAQALNAQLQPEPVPPVSPFIKAALVAMLATIVNLTCYVFLRHGGAGPWMKHTALFCALITFLCLLVDFLMFRAEQKQKA